MLKRYEKFLEEFDKTLVDYFDSQKSFIKCKKGCCLCCEKGEYPFSRLEAEYLMSGFVKLPKEKKDIIRNNIYNLLERQNEFTGDRFLYKCPFLLDKECSLYSYRGIVCRVHGLAYFDKFLNCVRLPECTREGLNYSELFNIQNSTLNLENPINDDLTIYGVLRSAKSQQYQLECGEIRSLINWFNFL